MGTRPIRSKIKENKNKNHRVRTMTCLKERSPLLRKFTSSNTRMTSRVLLLTKEIEASIQRKASPITQIKNSLITKIRLTMHLRIPSPIPSIKPNREALPLSITNDHRQNLDSRAPKARLTLCGPSVSRSSWPISVAFSSFTAPSKVSIWVGVPLLRI